MSLESDLQKLGIPLPSERVDDGQRSEGEIALTILRDVMDGTFWKRPGFEPEDAYEVMVALQIQAHRLAHALAQKGINAVTSSSSGILPLRERDSWTMAGVVHRGPCKHVRVDADVTADRLKCHDCGKWVNPMWWLAAYAVTIHRSYEAMAHARQEQRDLQAEIAELKRQRANHMSAIRRAKKSKS